MTLLIMLRLLYTNLQQKDLQSLMDGKEQSYLEVRDHKIKSMHTRQACFFFSAFAGAWLYQQGCMHVSGICAEKQIFEQTAFVSVACVPACMYGKGTCL